MSRKYFYKGRRDAINKRYNPPQKGTNWRNTALVGGAVGVLTVANPLAGAVVGGIVGSLFGDTDQQTKRKSSNRKAYHAGHRYKKRFKPKRNVIVIYK